MAERLSDFPPLRKVKCLDHDAECSSGKIRSLVLNSNEPFILTKSLKDWSCCCWTPEILANALGFTQISFRICAKRDSPHYKFDKYKVVMESDCLYAKASLMNYCAWLTGEVHNAGELAKYPRAHFWCYADYKYMVDIFKDYPTFRQAPEWGKLGFPEITGDQSTIWIGSEGSSTPCHLDTYGCNMVAQIYGKKNWCLFPPSETGKLYPTRIPYEESSIFSQVNVKNPDLNKTPDFRTAVKYEVTLEPGDVLLVPRHWWHFVESLEPSISINTWITLESDHVDRVREAITRILVCSMKFSEGEHPDRWLNPTEKTGSHNQHLQYIRNAVNNTIAQEEQSFATEEEIHCNITYNDVIDCVTSPQIVSGIADQLLQIGRVKGKILKGCDGCNVIRKHVSGHDSQKEPIQNSCNCKCCLSDINRQGMLTRHTKRYLDQNSTECFPCCRNSPQKKKRISQMGHNI